MTRTHASSQRIDVGRALDLLADAVQERGEYFVYPPVWIHSARRPYASDAELRCLVGQALFLAGVADEDLAALGDVGVRDLYTRGALPVRVTLGALAVLDAAQRAQDRGYAWGDALDYAQRVATRFLDLVPDAALQAAAAGRHVSEQLARPGTKTGEFPDATSAVSARRL